MAESIPSDIWPKAVPRHQPGVSVEGVAAALVARVEEKAGLVVPLATFAAGVPFGVFAACVPLGVPLEAGSAFGVPVGVAAWLLLGLVRLATGVLPLWVCAGRFASFSLCVCECVYRGWVCDATVVCALARFACIPFHMRNLRPFSLT
jgi:hypothetical protein